jgi:hypothetical protein
VVVALVLRARPALLLALTLTGVADVESPVPYPSDYTHAFVKYAVVDRGDGMSRDLYVSPEGLEAVKREPRLSEFPVGVAATGEVQYRVCLHPGRQSCPLQ